MVPIFTYIFLATAVLMSSSNSLTTTLPGGENGICQPNTLQPLNTISGSTPLSNTTSPLTRSYCEWNITLATLPIQLRVIGHQPISHDLLQRAMTIFESNVNAAFAHFQPDDEDPLFDKDQDPFQRWIQGSPAPAGSEFDFIVASEDNHDPLTRLSWLELMGILAALRTGYVEQPNRSFLFRFEVWRTQREPEEQVGWGELLLNADADSGVASPESAATGRRRGRRGRVL